MTVKKLFIVVFCFSSLLAFSQKVGLVLSGGGASGFAHIGVIQALEENGIPIDYITGTSAGALVGSLYAAGYSPEEIKQFVLSKAFLEMSKGIEQPEQKFLLREPESNAEMLSFSFDQQHITRHFLPTNFISSDRLDFELLRLLGPVSASYGEDFNKLFVPFRCVASDITRKESVILDRGKLNIAVRASMTFPFYLKPTSINDVLLFDGGLYNNFPADVMYRDFDPDYIIGSNVSYNADAPNDNDLIGQITNMLVTHSLFQLPCEQGFLIEPNPSVSTFEFEEIETAIKKGYESTIASIDSIRKYVTVYKSIDSLQLAREAFKAKIKEVRITGVETKVDNPRLTYTKRALYRKSKNENLSLSEIEKRYYRLYSAPQIDFMMPSLQMKSDSTYKLHLDVKKGKELSVGLGGHISSRPVNTGYFSLSYQSAGRVLTKTLLESYFGKFYGSARAQFKLDLPLVYPFSTSAYFVMNRWDYFKSFATFFEDVKPSFLVQNEMYSGIKINFPISRNMVGEADSRIFSLNDTYYQTTDFTNKDTADRTTFAGYALRVSMTQNSLNRRQFANSGHYFRFQARYVNGREHSTSGSTATNSYDLIKFHDWLNLSLDYQSFLVDNRVYHLGLQGQMVFNSQSMFANYTASLLSMTEFVLHPDALSYFLPEYRSPQFIGIGINNIFTIRNKVDIRLDAYLYQPFLQIEEAEDGSLSLSKPFKGDTYMASASIIYNSFIGPVRVTGNYFPKQNKPFAFQFSIGYILFNERAIR